MSRPRSATREDREQLRHEWEYEMAVEAIEERPGVFAPWEIRDVLDDLVAAGLLRPLDLQTGIHYVRTDGPPCAVREPIMYIYRCFDGRGRLLYVGCTSVSVSVRAAAHARTKAWWPEVTKITTEEVVGWTAGRVVETVAIRDEHPLHNKVNNTIRLRQVAAATPLSVAS